MFNWLIWFKNFIFGVEAKVVRRYNWKRQRPDVRDYKFTYVSTQLPSFVDLRPKMPPVVNQGDLGSCTANALAGALGFLEMQEQALNDGKLYIEEFSTSGFTAFSRLFIYWNERFLEGDTSQDAGAALRDGVKTLATVGACAETTWPYEVSLAFSSPSLSSFVEADKHKIDSYHSLEGTNIVDLKTCLAQGYPFVFGFTVFSSFESPSVASNGIVPMPSAFDREQGGHAVCAVGYDDERQAFIVRNSWGSDWADEGYFYLPYQYITDPDLANDFWTIRR